MAQISKIPLNKDIEDKIFKSFLGSLVNIETPEEATEFITNLLTPAEKIILVKRLAIAIFLERGYNYEEISGFLKVSTSTVGSTASGMKQKGAKFRKYLDRESTIHHWPVILEYLSAFLTNAREEFAANPHTRRMVK